MNAKTEQRILQIIAAGDPWWHRNMIIHLSGRSYYTVIKYLKDLRDRGLIECSEGPLDYLEEWWRLTDAGKAHMQEGKK